MLIFSLLRYSYRIKYIGLLASFFLNSTGKSFNEMVFLDVSTEVFFISTHQLTIQGKMYIKT